MFNSLEKSLYCIYDKKLKKYSNVFVASGPDAKRIFIELANDVTSPQYGFASDYDCLTLGYFDEESATIGSYNESLGCYIPCKTVICGLDNFIDEKRIELQHMISVLNYLPSGYFKMPAEMQEEIKEQINEATKKYADYLCQNMELSSSQTPSSM